MEIADKVFPPIPTADDGDFGTGSVLRICHVYAHPPDDDGLRARLVNAARAQAKASHQFCQTP